MLLSRGAYSSVIKPLCTSIVGDVESLIVTRREAVALLPAASLAAKLSVNTDPLGDRVSIALLKTASCRVLSSCS